MNSLLNGARRRLEKNPSSAAPCQPNSRRMVNQGFEQSGWRPGHRPMCCRAASTEYRSEPSTRSLSQRLLRIRGQAAAVRWSRSDRKSPASCATKHRQSAEAGPVRQTCRRSACESGTSPGSREVGERSRQTTWSKNGTSHQVNGASQRTPSCTLVSGCQKDPPGSLVDRTDRTRAKLHQRR